MKAPDLLPCPFCGRKPWVGLRLMRPGDFTSSWGDSIGCFNCNIYFTLASYGSAKRKWNRRKEGKP